MAEVVLSAMGYALLSSILLVIVLWARYRLFLSRYLREPLAHERAVLSGLVPGDVKVYMLVSGNPPPLRLTSLLRRGRVLGIALWPGVIALDPDLVRGALYSPRLRVLLSYIIAHEEGHLRTFIHSILLFSAGIGLATAISSLLPPPLDTLILVVLAVAVSAFSTMGSEKLADMHAERKTGLRRKYLVRALAPPGLP